MKHNSISYHKRIQLILLLFFAITINIPCIINSAEISEFIDLPRDEDGTVEKIAANGTAAIGDLYSWKCYGPRQCFQVSDAYLWTESEGFQEIGTFEDSWGDFSKAYGISENGKFVVGNAAARYEEPGHTYLSYQAYLWSNDEGMIGLGELPGGEYDSTATGVSSDGQVVVGYSYSDLGKEAFVWKEHTGMVGIGDLAGGIFSSQAYDVSADGKVVIGVSEADSGREGFYWTSKSGMVSLGQLPNGSPSTSPRALSSNGSVIVGAARNEFDALEAFRWTKDEGMHGLGFLVGTR